MVGGIKKGGKSTVALSGLWVLAQLLWAPTCGGSSARRGLGDMGCLHVGGGGVVLPLMLRLGAGMQVGVPEPAGR